MANEPYIEARVIERLPNLLYKVKPIAAEWDPLQVDKEYICYLSGKMKINKIGVMVGDRVRVIIDPHGGKATNRIIRRI